MSNLCITMKLDEKVKIKAGDKEVFVTVILSRNKKVRLLFQADKDVRIERAANEQKDAQSS